jgi:hypothetical protein
MKVKVFQDTGYQGIAKVQKDANAWLAANPSIWVANTQTSMCGIGNPHEEIYQSFAITFFYDEERIERRPRR